MSKIKVTLIRSLNGRQERQIKTCHALGLKHIDDTNIHEDNGAIRGMIAKVPHLVKVEEVKGE